MDALWNMTDGPHVTRTLLGSLRQRLLRGEASLCVWGMGYVGYSAAAFFSARGIRVIGVDPDRRRGESVRARRCPVRGLDAWLRAAGVDPAPAITVYGDAAQVPQDVAVAAHHVAVPTERGGRPWADALLDVCRTIAYRFAPDALVVVESTVTPGMLDAARDAAPSLRFVAAPRRDWFDSPDKHLGALPRIVGGDDPAVLEAVESYLSVVCPRLVRAPDLRTAALVKVVENDLRHVELCYANELARAIGSHYDVRRILELAATKWNVPQMWPSIGVGGACLPLAGRYLAEVGAVPMSEEAQRSNARHNQAVEKLLAGYGSVAFLGVGYKSAAPFTPSAPAVLLLEGLCCRIGAGVAAVGVFPDSEQEEAVLSGAFPKVSVLLWPDGFGGGAHAALVVPVASDRARALTEASFRRAPPYRLVLDNEGALAHLSASLWDDIGTDYRIPGRAGWLAGIM